MIKHFIYILLLSYTIHSYGQKHPFREVIETDSSTIEIIRNSVYRCYEETFNKKDSIWWNVTYIDDTTKLNTEGWRNKKGDRIGKWSEYNKNGTWLYTIDYNSDTWEYNKTEYPFQNVLDSMKVIADNIIIQKYGKDFFENNVTFKFHGNLAIYDSVTYGSDTYWSAVKQLGDWLFPIKEKPNTYSLDYTIKLDDNHFYYDLLKINLDSIGNIIEDDNFYSISLEDRENRGENQFSLTYDKAITICKLNGLNVSDTLRIDEKLACDKMSWNNNKEDYYFEIRQLYDIIKEGECPKKCTVAQFYEIWRINPWNSKLIYHKKVKQMQYWNRGHGQGGNYEELDE